MFAYLILPRGPFRSGKLRVLNAWMPASWSPSNCVTFPEQPASLASFGSPNHNPTWKVCTGSYFGFFSASNLSTCGAFTLPGANTNNSSLKMPLALTSPWPWLLVVKSAWYQETPKGLLGCWVMNSSNSVFFGAWLRVTSMIWLSVGVVRTSTLALAPSRHSLSTAASERTILKVVSSTAKAATANTAAISSAPPTASTTRLVVLFLFTFFFLSSLANRHTLRLSEGGFCALGHKGPAATDTMPQMEYVLHIAEPVGEISPSISTGPAHHIRGWHSPTPIGPGFLG